MYHYAYLLTFQDNMKYVGARSTKVKPQLDSTYLGSGRNLPSDRHDNRHTVNKIILQEFNNREDLIKFEENFIRNNNCVESDEWHNLRYSNYDKYGKNHVSSGFTTESRKKSMATVKRRDYSKGANRTPALLAADLKRGQTILGTKNPAKGHKGITNQAFIPWYYIDPEGNYVEVHNETKRDKAEQLGFTERQLTQAFHYTNIHQEARTLPRKGWTFGNIPRP